MKGKPYTPPASPNLVATWRSIVTNGNTEPLTGPLAALNAACGTSYRHSRVSAWEKGLNGRRPDGRVTSYMLEQVLPVLLSREGLPENTIRAITSAVSLCPPTVKHRG